MKTQLGGVKHFTGSGQWSGCSKSRFLTSRKEILNLETFCFYSLKWKGQLKLIYAVFYSSLIKTILMISSNLLIDITNLRIVEVNCIKMYLKSAEK